MLDDALAARVLVCGRALGALLLLSLLSLARDDPRAHIVPRAKPTVVCAVCRGICHSGTGRARGHRVALDLASQLAAAANEATLAISPN